MVKSDKEFLQMLLGDFSKDPPYDVYLACWVGYHRNADKDPRRANGFLAGYRMSPDFDRDKWLAAKLQAVRIVEREEYALQNKTK